MGNRESLTDCIGDHLQAVIYTGRVVVKAFNSSHTFCGGPEYWKSAAQIKGGPINPPEHFEPQNYSAPQSTELRQGEQ